MNLEQREEEGLTRGAGEMVGKFPPQWRTEQLEEERMQRWARIQECRGHGWTPSE